MYVHVFLEMDFREIPCVAPSVGSVGLRSCRWPTARWTWSRPCRPSTGSTGRGFYRKPTESWSPVAAWRCVTTCSTWNSATPTAACDHSTTSAKRCLKNNPLWTKLLPKPSAEATDYARLLAFVESSVWSTQMLLSAKMYPNWRHVAFFKILLTCCLSWFTMNLWKNKTWNQIS